MKLRELINEGPVAQGVGNVARSAGAAAGAAYQKTANAVNSPTAQGIKSGLAKSFGAGSGMSSVTSPASSNVLKGIDTNALKLGLTKIIDKQQIQQDELVQIKKLLDKLA
jgi:hypothetical protein